MNKFRRVLKQIRKYNRFLLTSHINPEGDSVGSQLAFAHLLKAMGKKSYILNPHSLPSRYNFLPGSNKILTYLKPGIRYDAICFLDCADAERTGNIYKMIDLSKPKINIDHHISNKRFGDINLVDARASSTAEILYILFKEAKIKIDKNTAACLYAGILTDTGSFNYSSVTSFTHRVISHLIKIGVKPEKIYKKIHEENSPAMMRLLGSALSIVELSKDKKLAWTQVTKDMLKRCKAGLRDAEDFVNFLRSIKGIQVAILFTEIGPRKIKVNLRSSDIVDVNKIASVFGGGGHQKASGCTIKGALSDVKKKVLSEVGKYV